MTYDISTRGAACGMALVLCVAAFWGLSSSTRAQSTPAEYRSYPLRHVRADAIEGTLRSMVERIDRSAQVISSPATNEILVQGPEAVQQNAVALIQAMDRPDTAQAMGPAAAPSNEDSLPRGSGLADSPGASAQVPASTGSLGAFKIYPCEPSEVDALTARLNGLFANRPEVRIMASPRGRAEVFVVAPEDAHRAIEQYLAAGRPSSPEGAPVASPRAASAAGPRPVPTGASSRDAPNSVRLVHKPVREVEASLRNVLGGRLQARGDSSSPPTYRFVSPTQEVVDIRFEPSANRVDLAGPQPLVHAMSRLLRYLDHPRSAQDAVRILPLRNADPAKIREAARAFQEGYRQPSAPTDARQPQARRRPPRGRPSWNGPAAEFARGISPAAPMVDPAVRRASYYQEAVDGGQSAGVATVGPEDPPRLTDETYDLAPDVMVDLFPELDVVILRGSDTAVDRLAELIEAIERISAETEPRIKIHYLKHVDCVSITTVIMQIYEALLGGRQGRVTVLPLVKPNALLMVGWGDAVTGVEELIQKLDEPAAPEARFRLFLLKHASAMYVAGTVQQLYGVPAALAPRVRVVPDQRLNALIVQAAPRDLAEVEALVQSLDVSKSDSVNQVRMFRLKNSLATDLVQVLQQAISAANRSTAGGRPSMLELPLLDGGQERIVASGLLNDVLVTANVRTNTVIVTGPAESMALIELMIKQLDQPSAVAQIKVFRIVNGDATSLVTMLQDLIPSQLAGQPGAQLPGAEGEDALVPVRFSVDQRSNSIIAAGSEGDLRIIEALLFKLDSENLRARENAVYRLKNSPAAAVAAAVNEFLRSRRAVQQAAPGVFSPFQQLESEVIIVPEPVSNALVVSATPEYFTEIMDLIERLDAQPAQVTIQVLIAQVTLNETDEFGVELGLQDAILFDRSVSASNALVPGYLFNSGNPLGNSDSSQSLATADLVGSQGISNLGVGRVNTELGYGGFVFSASSESVSVLIRALQECRRLDVLSRPQVTTLDNQPAFIQVGKRVPRIAGVTSNNWGQTNEVVTENVGLILAVTPRISPDGKVVMEIDAEKSSLDSVNDGVPVAVSDGQTIRSPAVSVTTAQTTVSAANGETIIIGGLITTTKSKAHRQVPYLGDIPIVGNLFSYDYVSSQRDELLIILTPRIVTDPEDHAVVRDTEMARLHWCLRDVTELHGDIGAYDITAPLPATGDAPVMDAEPIDLDTIVPMDELPSPPSASDRESRPRRSPPETRPEGQGGSPTLAPPRAPDRSEAEDPAENPVRVATGAWDDWGVGVDPAYHTSVSYGDADGPRRASGETVAVAPPPTDRGGPGGNAGQGPPNATRVSYTDPRATSNASGGAMVAYGPQRGVYRPRVPLREQFEQAMARADSSPGGAVSSGTRRRGGESTDAAVYDARRYDAATGMPYPVYR